MADAPQLAAVEYLAVGDLGVDSVVSTDHLPRPDEKIWLERQGDFSGGMIGNAAVTAAKLGCPAGVCALLGSDSLGDLVLADLGETRVNVDLVLRLDAPTFWTLSVTTATGDRSLLQFPTEAFGANWEALDLALLPALRWLHTAAEQRPPAEVLFEAKERGVRISLDVERPYAVEEALTPLLPFCDLVLLNEAAAEDLGGLGRAMVSVASHGADVVAVTRGALGSEVRTAGETVHIEPFAVDAVDTNGAGDAYGAAFAVSLLRGHRPDSAARFASAVAGASTTAYGGHSAGLHQFAAVVETQTDGRTDK